MPHPIRGIHLFGTQPGRVSRVRGRSHDRTGDQVEARDLLERLFEEDVDPVRGASKVGEDPEVHPVAVRLQTRHRQTNAT